MAVDSGPEKKVARATASATEFFPYWTTGGDNMPEEDEPKVERRDGLPEAALGY